MNNDSTPEMFQKLLNRTDVLTAIIADQATTIDKLNEKVKFLEKCLNKKQQE